METGSIVFKYDILSDSVQMGMAWYEQKIIGED